MTRACPFCGAETPGATCGGCGRDVAAARRPCPACKKMTPSSELICCHCKTRMGSELSWKIPLIVLMFVAAIAISILLNVFR